jgi:hypothetical protein
MSSLRTRRALAALPATLAACGGADRTSTEPAPRPSRGVRGVAASTTRTPVV